MTLLSDATITSYNNKLERCERIEIKYWICVQIIKQIIRRIFLHKLYCKNKELWIYPTLLTAVCMGQCWRKDREMQMRNLSVWCRCLMKWLLCSVGDVTSGMPVLCERAYVLFWQISLLCWGFRVWCGYLMPASQHHHPAFPADKLDRFDGSKMIWRFHHETSVSSQLKIGTESN